MPANEAGRRNNLRVVDPGEIARALLDHPASQAPREVVFSNWIDGLNFSARTNRYKLIRNLVPVDSTGRECPPYELYDLERDPLELTNVADEPAYAEAYNTMRRHLDGWLAQMDDPTVHGELTADEHEAMITEYRRRYEQSRTATAASA